MSDDVVMACVDLVGRSGASGFEIGFVHDDVPIEEAGWHASAQFHGTRIMVQDHRSPTGAALALSERMLRGAACRCGHPVTLSDDRPGCRWRLVGKRWEPGCNAEPIHVKGDRGDYEAMVQAYNNRAARRGAKKRKSRG
jgi:hypothetical protein